MRNELILEKEKLQLEIKMIQNQNEMLQKQMRNLDSEFKLSELKKMHFSLKLKAEFGVDIE